MDGSAEVTIKWTLEVQKFRACPRHDARYEGYEPYDPECPDCVITEPPVVADVDEPRREAT